MDFSEIKQEADFNRHPWWGNEYYREDGEPIKCDQCGSTEIKTQNMAYEQGYESERKYLCSECGFELAYWAYGFFDPNYGPEHDPEEHK